MKKLILLAIILALVVPAAMANVQNIAIIKAVHRTGTCVYSVPDKTSYTCNATYQDITAKVQAIAQGNRFIKFDTHRKTGGMFTEYGLAWQMPTDFQNNQFATINYRIGNGPIQQLGIRDRCWFNLGDGRVWCPAFVLPNPYTGGMDEMFV